MLIPCDACAVPNDPSAASHAGAAVPVWRPTRARLIVPQVEGFSRRIGQRIVGERRQPVLAAHVNADPSCSRSCRRRDSPARSTMAAAFRVRHRARRHIAPVAREAAEPVLHDQRRDRHRCWGGSRRIECGRSRNVMLVVQPGGRPLQLRHQIAEIAGQNDLGTDRRRRSCSGIPSPRSRNVPPGFPSQPTHGGSCTRLDSRLCISSR